MPSGAGRQAGKPDWDCWKAPAEETPCWSTIRPELGEAFRLYSITIRTAYSRLGEYWAGLFYAGGKKASSGFRGQRTYSACWNTAVRGNIVNGKPLSTVVTPLPCVRCAHPEVAAMLSRKFPRCSPREPCRRDPRHCRDKCPAAGPLEGDAGRAMLRPQPAAVPPGRRVRPHGQPGRREISHGTGPSACNAATGRVPATFVVFEITGSNEFLSASVCAWRLLALVQCAGQGARPVSPWAPGQGRREVYAS